MATDDSGTPDVPPCAHCGAALDPGHVTCPRCGAVRFLAIAGDGSPPPTTVPSAPAEHQGHEPGTGADDEVEAFDLGDPFRDTRRRRPREPAERSRTTLLVGGLIGLVLVVLVAAAALWALGQHGGSAGL